jgi:hypothetical protein
VRHVGRIPVASESPVWTFSAAIGVAGGVVHSKVRSSGASRPRADTFSTDAIWPPRTSSAESKLFTVEQTWRGKR